MGLIAKIKVLRDLGVHPGKECIKAMELIHIERVRDAEYKFKNSSKEERQKRSRARRKLEEDFLQLGEDPYEAGFY